MELTGIKLPVKIVEKGEFLSRPNRFTTFIQLKGKKVTAHLSDTGRLAELLQPGVKTYLSANPNGKLDYKLIGVEVEGEPILLAPFLHSHIAHSLILKGGLGFIPKQIKREVSISNGRLDFLVDGKIWVEVKGCNLKRDKLCLFPDAPTSRGRKHLKFLIRQVKKGGRGIVLFLLFRSCSQFTSNITADPKFATTLKESLEVGVEIIGIGMRFIPTVQPEVQPVGIIPFLKPI